MNAEKVQFIVSQLRQGLGRQAIMEHYQAVWSDSLRTFDRVLRRAKDVLAQEYDELHRHRLDVMKSEQSQVIRTSCETVLRLQRLSDELYDHFFSAKTTKERIDTALALVKVVSEINRMQGYYATAKSEVDLQIEPSENTIGKYFELVDARLRQEHARELNDALD